MPVRIGEVMVQNGLLTPDQVKIILKEQQELQRPFGELAERLFNVGERDVERAWALQYAEIVEHVDPYNYDIEASAVGLITRRQAWQFRMMPLSHDAAEVVVVTVVQHLPRAMRFAMRQFEAPCYFVLTDAESLSDILTDHYPLDGMGLEHVISKASAPFGEIGMRA